MKIGRKREAKKKTAGSRRTGGNISHWNKSDKGPGDLVNVLLLS